MYGHHDVQPAGPADLWDTPPFEASVRGDAIHARGASDDKGQMLMHALGLGAHLAAGGRAAPAVNLKILVEGEEESGSPHFQTLIETYAGRLSCDVVVNSDASMWSKDVRTTCTGMRGMLAAEVVFRGPDNDIHSGSFGGAVPNPLTELCRALGRLHDDDGRVAVPGFYDGVADLGDAERELFARLPFDEGEWLATAGSRATHGERGHALTPLSHPAVGAVTRALGRAFEREVLYTREGGS
ncbi:M20/M25/M40 family metallo-hydrolase, partial [Nonomuraea deserti]